MKINTTFLRMGWRNLVKRKLYASLEIGGLALGLSCTLLIVTYYVNEIGYDQCFSKSNKTYRILHVTDEGSRYSGVPSALAHHIREEVPQVKQAVNVFWPLTMFSQTTLVENPDTDIRFYEDQLLVVDTTFFDLFDFHFISGNPKTALLRKESIVISKTMAEKYFPDTSPMGKILLFGNVETVVTGVIDDDIKTHLAFGFLRPVTAYPHLIYTWEQTLAFSYIELEETDVPNVTAQLYPVVLTHSKNANAKYLQGFHHTLQPLQDIHTTTIDWDVVTPTSHEQLVMVLVIAIFILVIAIVNFINLTTSRFTEKMKAMGINSVLGATGSNLTLHVVVEFAITLGFASLLCVAISVSALPFFSELIGTLLTADDLLSPTIIFIFTMIIITILICVSLYPAIRLHGFKSIDVMKRTTSGSIFEQRFRRGLVIFQFLIAGALITATFIVHSQINFLKNTSLGFDKDQIVVIRLRENVSAFNILKDALLTNANVSKVAGASTAMGLSTGSEVFIPGHMSETDANKLFANTISVDEHFLDLMGIKLSSGRTFTGGAGDYNNSYIVNESTLRKYNIENPENTSFRNSYQADGRIIGVVKDFYYNATSHNVDALVMRMDSAYSHAYMLVKIQGNISSALAHIETTWSSIIPSAPLEYSFQDEYLDRLYKKESEAQQLATVFSVLSIVIALLSLFGLSSYSVLKRTKEIAIRKIAGATSNEILYLLTFDFLKLVLIAAGLSIPITYFLMKDWLEQFANRVELGPQHFIISILATIILACVVVMIQSANAARATPAKTIRTE